MKKYLIALFVGESEWTLIGEWQTQWNKIGRNKYNQSYCFRDLRENALQRSPWVRAYGSIRALSEADAISQTTRKNTLTTPFVCHIHRDTINAIREATHGKQIGG